MKLYVYLASVVMVGITTNWMSAQEHGFSVRDDIEMARFSDPSTLQDSARPKYSPDGRYVAVVTSRGLLSSDTIESTVYTFKASAVYDYAHSNMGAEPSPRILAQIRSFPHSAEAVPYAPVISDMRWSADSRQLYFRGENMLGNHQIYKVGLDGGGITSLTSPTRDVTHFDIGGSIIAYTATLTGTKEINSPAMVDARINKDAITATGLSLSELLGPPSGVPISGSVGLWTLKSASYGRADRLLFHIDQADSQYIPEVFSVSPTGRWLITLSPLIYAPPEWDFFEAAVGFEKLARPIADPWIVSPNNLDRLKRYTLVDLARGVEEPLINAPYGRTFGYGDLSAAVWSTDGTRVAVANTFLPISADNGVEQLQVRTPCAIATVDVPDGTVNCVMLNSNRAAWNPKGVHLRNISFGDSKEELIVRVNELGGSEVQKNEHYLFKDGHWKLASSDLQNVEPSKHSENGLADLFGIDSLQISIQQNVNAPPALWVSDPKAGIRKKLWDPNPQFAHLEFGDVSVYRWRDKDGHEWKGGLVKPIHYHPGNRYPLVVQIYDFDDREFMTNGMDPTAFAARPLASAGIMVLQLQRYPVHTFDANEDLRQVEGLESAVASLSTLGLIAPDRVGVVGFSITCQYVENALISRPDLFAAATIADGLDNSYMQYLLTSSSTARRENELYIGSQPFGDGLTQWIEKAPGFHLDKVMAPLRLESIGTASLLAEWETYSALSAQDKPVDLIYFPSGQHIHQKPVERLASQQGDVDWFRFWLQDYKDHNPEKASQYRHWEKLRAMRDKERIDH